MNKDNKKILRALNGSPSDIPPVWFMRQAGRYLPEYRAVRQKMTNFLELCYTPERAAEVTLQPITRFGFDAAIIFSDILVIPDALGVSVNFVPNKGPVLETVTTQEALDSLQWNPQKLEPVYQALQLVKEALPSHCTLIGFAGAPWTLATYLVEGGSSRDFKNVKSLAYHQPEFFEALIQKLTLSVIEHLSLQIENGAEVVQLFDSWASVLSESQYRQWVIKPTQRIANSIKQKYPKVPIIGFPKGSGVLYKEFVQNVDINGVSIDYTVPVSWARDHLNTTLQGNLDPICLQANLDQAVRETQNITTTLRNKPFIFNLGHGILPSTPIEHVETIIETIRNG